jgi:hypothetical protein
VDDEAGKLDKAEGDIDSSATSSAPEQGAHIPLDRRTFLQWMSEGRPFEVGNQVLISSHRKLLSSKAMVVNVAEKSERDFGRYD